MNTESALGDTKPVGESSERKTKRVYFEGFDDETRADLAEAIKAAGFVPVPVTRETEGDHDPMVGLYRRFAPPDCSRPEDDNERCFGYAVQTNCRSASDDGGATTVKVGHETDTYEAALDKVRALLSAL